MHENCCTKVGSCLENREHALIIEIPAIDVGSDLDSRQAQRMVAALEFCDRQIGVLHGKRAQADKPFGMIGDHTGNVVIQNFGQVCRVGRLCPVAEHDWHSRENLYVDAGTVAVRDPHTRIPAIRFDIPKQFAVLQHARTARAVMFELDEATVTVAFLQVGPILRQDVRVNVDLEHTKSGALLRHHGAALRAGPVLFGIVETVKNWWQLTDDIAHIQKLLIQLVIAVVTEPHEAVEFFRQAFAFNDQADRVCKALRRMWNFRWQQQDFAFANRNIHALAILYRLQQHVAFKLVKKFRTFVVVKIFARVGATNNHDDEVVFVEHLLVTNRRLQQVPVFVNPLLEVEGHQRPHHSILSLFLRPQCILVRLQSALVVD